MEIVLTRDELQSMLNAAAEIGVRAYIAQSSPTDDRLSQREAFRQYGKTNVQRWIKEGKIKGVRCAASATSPIYYSVVDLKIIQQSEKQQILN